MCRQYAQCPHALRTGDMGLIERHPRQQRPEGVQHAFRSAGCARGKQVESVRHRRDGCPPRGNGSSRVEWCLIRRPYSRGLRDARVGPVNDRGRIDELGYRFQFGCGGVGFSATVQAPTCQMANMSAKNRPSPPCQVMTLLPRPTPRRASSPAIPFAWRADLVRRPCFAGTPVGDRTKIVEQKMHQPAPFPMAGRSDDSDCRRPCGCVAQVDARRRIHRETHRNRSTSTRWSRNIAWPRSLASSLAPKLVDLKR